MDTILNLIRLAGDYVSEEVWYRIVEVVINTQEVQGYAAKTCFEVSSVCVCVCVCEMWLFYVRFIAGQDRCVYMRVCFSEQMWYRIQ